MKVKQYQRGADVLHKEAEGILSSSNEAKYIHKVAMVNLVLQEIVKPRDLAKGIGSTHQTISNWIKLADEKGFEALKEKPKSGRPTKMTEEIAVEIDALLQENCPENHGYYVWDVPSISKYIKETHGLDYSVRSCQRLMRDLGYTLLRAQTFPSKDPDLCDDEDRQRYKEEMQAIIEDENSILVFQDEVHFFAQTTIRRMWAEKGSSPKVASKVGKDSAGYSGFVVHGTGQLFIYEPEKFNYETTIQSIVSFLDEIPLEEGQKICLVMDNAPWHKKAKRLINAEDEYADIREKIRFVALPPYSPDLNPIEQVWRITRYECTHNRYFASKQVLKDTLAKYWEPYKKPNEKFTKLCSFTFKEREPKPERIRVKKHFRSGKEG